MARALRTAIASPAEWRKSKFMNQAIPAFAKRLLVAMLTVATGLASPLPAAAQLPSLGDGAEMSLAAELRIGERVAKEIYRDPDYLDDPVLSEYVQSIWQPLMAAARARGDLSPDLAERFAWEVMLLRDRAVNAFALPGGFLGVNTGLINIVTSKDELASVLAHELSHVTQRHIVRLIANQGRTTPLLIGAMLLGILAASRNPAAANAMIVGGSAVAAQTQLNFSRDMEREADRVGFGVLNQAGFDPRGFASMFGKLQTASRINDNGSFPYLRSHPLTTERIADMQNRETQIGANTQAPPMTLEHAMTTARSRVRTDPGVDVLRSYAAEVTGSTFDRKDAVQRAGALYAAVLANLRLQDVRAARASLGPLGALVKGDPAADRLHRLLTGRSRTGRWQRGRRVGAVEGRAAGPAARVVVVRASRKPRGRAGSGRRPTADLGGAAPARCVGLAAAGRGPRRAGRAAARVARRGRSPRRAVRLLGRGGPLSRGAGSGAQPGWWWQSIAGRAHRGVDHRHPAAPGAVNRARTGARALSR